jgi:hypothetical protein
VIAASGYSYYMTSSSAYVALFEGGSIRGNLDDGDAKARVVQAAGGYGTYNGATPTVLSHVDLTGDGLADVVYGNPLTSVYTPTNKTYYGEVNVFDGSDLTGNVTPADATNSFDGDSTDYAGTALAAADVDGDGLGDVFIGVAGDDAGRTDAGAIYLVTGADLAAGSHGNIDAATVTLTVIGDRGSAALGLGQLALGDFDDDGTLDLAAAATGLQTVYVFNDVGSLSGEVQTNRDEDARITGSRLPAAYGLQLEAADLDGDGVSDLVVAGPDATSAAYATTADQVGEVHVFAGGGFTLRMTTSDRVSGLYGPTNGELLGLGLLASDLDGDGDVDLSVASPAYATSHGRVRFVLD